MESKTLARAGLLAVAAIQVALILVLVIPKERTLATGQVVVLQTVPVDPRDLFRGDYVVLRYEISTLSNYEGLGRGETVYVRLQPSGSVWHAVYVSRTKPNDGLFIRGRVSSGLGNPFAEGTVTVEYGIESYFVPEGTGHIIERAQDVKVKVAIKSGNAVIKEVLVDGQPFEP